MKIRWVKILIAVAGGSTGDYAVSPPYNVLYIYVQTNIVLCTYQKVGCIIVIDFILAAFSYTICPNILLDVDLN